MAQAEPAEQSVQLGLPAVLYAPAMHVLQAAAAAAALYVPALEVWMKEMRIEIKESHSWVPLPPSLPGFNQPRTEHATTSAPLRHCAPAGHVAHAVSAVLFAYVPAAHAVGAAVALGHLEPRGHIVHCVAPVVVAVQPVAHAVQALVPVELAYVPTLQAMALPLMQYDPVGHDCTRERRGGVVGCTVVWCGVVWWVVGYRASSGASSGECSCRTHIGRELVAALVSRRAQRARGRCPRSIVSRVAWLCVWSGRGIH